MQYFCLWVGYKFVERITFLDVARLGGPGFLLQSFSCFAGQRISAAIPNARYAGSGISAMHFDSRYFILIKEYLNTYASAAKSPILDFA